MTVEQIVSTAGDGNLRDGAACSLELRKYFAQIPSSKLAHYIEYCLSSGFQKSGMVLQDLVNELGRRLDYTVINGRYQGTPSTIGFDGLWKSPESHSIVLETKTTDTYRISLETLVGYRSKLLATSQIDGDSSILIVVGREDTGELEAQIRGSRYAWDIRLISADALLKLVQLKENSESLETGGKIRSLLTPMEYTRLDEMVDVMFTTVTDVDETSDLPNTSPEPPKAPDGGEREKDEGLNRVHLTDNAVIQGKREKMVEAMAQKTGAKFIKRSRALFWDAEHKTRLAATISKRYDRSSAYRYWYAFHPQWDEFLRDGATSFFVLGGVDLPFAFAIPWNVIHGILSLLNTTSTDRSTYWHIHVAEHESGRYELQIPKRSENLSLDRFQIALQE
jgi:hypothetical protein